MRPAPMFTDRYDVFGPPSKCVGPCEGTGFVPVAPPTDDKRLSALWRACEIRRTTDDGYHFVPCPDCHPEAQPLLRLMAVEP